MSVIEICPNVYTPALADTMVTAQSHAPAMLTRYQKRISGPLFDHIYIHIEAPHVG